MFNIVIIFLLLLNSVLYAKNDLTYYAKPLVKSYFKSNNIKINNNYISLIKRDKNFQMANEYLYNKNLLITPAKNYQKMPDYKRALEEFAKSAKIYKNPISAYEGLYIIKAYFYNKNYKKLRFLFAKILSQNKICSGYIYYGDLFLKNNKNIKKAKEIYKNGYKQCKHNNTYKNIFRTKIAVCDWRERIQKK